MKIKNLTHERSHKLDRIGVRRIRTFPFLLILLTTPPLNDPVKTRLLESEAEAFEVGAVNVGVRQWVLTSLCKESEK